MCFSLKIFGATNETDPNEMAATTTDGANVMEGTKMTNSVLSTSRTESPMPTKMVGSKKKYRSRSQSTSSQDSATSGSYSGQFLHSLQCPG